MDHSGEYIDLQRSFDDAVASRVEDEAIIYGSDLLKNGEIVHVMLGFKKLANSGFQQSKQLYITLAYRLSAIIRRQNENIDFYYQMQINELCNAIGMAESLYAEDMAVDSRMLKCELMCWHMLAWENISDNEVLKWKHYHSAKNLMKELNLSESDSEYFDFSLKYGHWFY